MGSEPGLNLPLHIGSVYTGHLAEIAGRTFAVGDLVDTAVSPQVFGFGMAAYSEEPINRQAATDASNRVFEGLFTGARRELRTLLSAELAFVARRMGDNPPTFDDAELQESFQKWNRAMRKEREAVLEELQQQMEAAAADPNFVIESFFYSQNLAAKVLTSPTYATAGNAAAISAMSAVQQLRLPTWAIKLDPETLRTAQLLAVSQPTLRFTYKVALDRGIVSPAGKQTLIRRDIVERVALMLELTARLQHQFFDSMASVLPQSLRKLLKEALCSSFRPPSSTDVASEDAARSLGELVDRIGFATTFRLMVFALTSGRTIRVLDRKDRIFTVGPAQDKAAPITLLEV